MDALCVHTALIDQNLKFEAVSAGNENRPLIFDYVPPNRGDGLLGLEALLMSFAGCVSTTIVFILRKMGKNVTGFHSDVVGIRKDKPLSLEKIDLEVTVESDNATDDDIKRALDLAKDLSPVWLAIKGNVAVSFRCKALDYEAVTD